MSVKKLLFGVASVAAVSMTTALAGGYDNTVMPTMPKMDAGYYFGGDVGYGYQNYKDNAVWRIHTGVETHDDAKGGFAGGLNFGCKLNKNIAFELGWIYLPKVNVNAAGATKAEMDSWVLYLAAKYMMPLTRVMKGDLFFKLGAAYRNNDIPTSATVAASINDRKSDYVRPMFAVGYERMVYGNLSAIAQYAYFMGANNSFPLSTANSGSLGTVAANLFTFGMAYTFVL